jgi:hypothetical protein
LTISDHGNAAYRYSRAGKPVCREPLGAEWISIVKVAQPSVEPIAGLVVIQEAFGVNRHIRSVADGHAMKAF